MWDVSDVHNDIKEHLGVVGSSLSRRIRGRSAYQQTWGSANERTSLLPDVPAVSAKSLPACSFAGYTSSDGGHSSNVPDYAVGPMDQSPDSQDNGNNVVNT